MMRFVMIVALFVPMLAFADNAKPWLLDEPVAKTKKDPFSDKRVRECILKHLDKARTDTAVHLIVRLCKTEHGY